jgi:hypothetical protein
MKKNNFLSFTLLIIVSASIFSACNKDKCTEMVTYTKYTPIYMTLEELRTSVASEQPRDLKNPGKIYIKGNYLFINEIDKGIHIYDNSNPSSPQAISFVNIPGNLDLAVSGNSLYADSYSDLLTLDISNPNSISIVNRNESVLPNRVYGWQYEYDPANGVVVEWIAQEVTEKIECSRNRGSIMFDDMFVGGPITNTGAAPNSNFGGTESGVRGAAPGIGGSMARFTISQSTLYVVDNSSLLLFNISSPNTPIQGTTTQLGWDIETIFPYGSHLFIGSATGMHIYNVSNPASPVRIAVYEHINACDPVVVDDNYAYVTLRSGTECQTFTNQLEIVDIQNLSNPHKIAEYPMTNPHGLGIRDGILFICDGRDGLKVYDAGNVLEIDQNLIRHYNNIDAFDVIPYGMNKLLMIGKNGLMQFDYTDINNIQLLSVINVTP